jgi:hypothetical protein
MKRRARSLAFLALVAPLSAALAQDLTPEQKQYIAANKVRWANIRTVQVAYQSPPKEWKTASVEELKARVSFPCEPKRSGVDRGTSIITTFLCSDGKTSYLLTYGKGKFGRDAELFYAGTEYGAEQFATKGGAKITMVPIMRVQYSGLSGREWRMITPQYVMQRRSFWINDSTLLDMQVVHELSYKGDNPKFFFNSLQVQ